MKRLLLLLATLLFTACASARADAPTANEPGVYQVSMVCKGPIGEPQQTAKGQWYEAYACSGGVLMFRPITVVESPKSDPEPSTDTP